jgi:hypothetical protein
MTGKATYKTGMEIAMIDTAGSVRVQMVRSTRSYVKSGLVMETAITDLTMAVAPAL